MLPDDVVNSDFSLKALFVPLTTVKAITIIILLGFFVYFNALFGEFLFDDFKLIVNNPYMQSVDNIFLHFTTLGDILNGRYYRPIQFMSFNVLYVLFGESTFFYHLLQVTLHIANTVLLYLFFTRFFRKSIALLSAIIFLVHPINVETVAYISDLQDVMYLFFGLLAIFLLHSASSLGNERKILVYFSLLLSLLSKETGVLFIPVIILYTFFFSNKKVMILSILISVFSLGTYLLLRYAALHRSMITNFPTPDVLHTTALTAPKMVFYYLSTFFFPKDLYITQLWLVHKFSLHDFFMPLGAVLIFIAIVIVLGSYLRKKHKTQIKLFTVFLVWFVSGIIIHLQLWLVDMTVADRWFYFPIIGFLGLLALSCSHIHITNSLIKKTAYLGIAMIIIILSIRTIARNMDFQTRIGLYQRDASYSDNPVLYRLLEEEYLRNKDIRNATQTLNKLLQIDPTNPYYNIYKAQLALLNGDTNKAKKYYSSLLGTEYEEIAYKSLLIVAINHNDYIEAKDLLKEAIKKYPRNAALWEALAGVELHLNHIDEATKAHQQFLHLK